MLKRQCAIKKSYKKTIVILFPLSENIQPSILSSNKNKNTIIIFFFNFFFLSYLLKKQEGIRQVDPLFLWFKFESSWVNKSSLFLVPNKF